MRLCMCAVLSQSLLLTYVISTKILNAEILFSIMISLGWANYIPNWIGGNRKRNCQRQSFDCHLLPKWCLMEIENTVSNDF